MARVDQTFPKLAASRTWVQWHKDGDKRNKREYAEALANPAVMDIVVFSIRVDHKQLSQVINWLRDEVKWDGRSPAGFDTRKKSWGSSARANFWADGTQICIQGKDKGEGQTQLTLYFHKDVAAYATLLKLTMG